MTEDSHDPYFDICDKSLNCTDASNYLGITPKGLRRLERVGKITGYRDKNLRLYFKIWELDILRDEVQYKKQRNKNKDK